ncbi:hypothetical protein SCUCBS95973_003137 [Sporothrix curviconia]|uniref:Zn(2)-C6 fungal-type domain-containing protein n=1 Tax=Sporothrix curviconia TaxID=1260050 RepID=A0ABP0BCV4_9PEZI
MPRLGYSKSRTGCLKCRQRRVKCDEQMPCSACRRHGIPCSLVTDGSSSAGGVSPQQTVPMGAAASRTSPQAPRSRPGTRRAAFSATARPVPFMASAVMRSGSEAAMSGSEAAPSGSEAAPSGSEAGGAHSPMSTADHPRAPTSSSSVSFNVPMDGPRLPDQHHLWATDMELMHHYSTTAFKSMPRAQDVPNIWQFEAPAAAFRDDFLLHLLLAYSAFHLAHLRPPRQSYYSYIAAYHQDLGISRMRASLSRMDEDNCHSLFMAGSLLAVGTFASLAVHATDKTDKRPTVDDLVEVIYLLKGVGSVLHSWEPVIHGGNFRELFLPSRPSEPAGPFWHELRAQLDLLHQPLADRLRDRPTLVACLDKELTSFHRLTRSSYETSSDPELRVVAAWPIDISDAFLAILKEQEPAALVLLAHYCVVVDRSAARNWFTHTWSREVLRKIHASLPPHYTELLRWPMEQMSAGTP